MNNYKASNYLPLLLSIIISCSVSASGQQASSSVETVQASQGVLASASATQLVDALQEKLPVDISNASIGFRTNLREILQSGNSAVVTMLSDGPRQVGPRGATLAKYFNNLVCLADTIVLARVDGSGSHFTESGKFIYTSYTLTALNVLRSRSGIVNGARFKAYRLGGTVISGNNVVSLNNPSFRNLQPTEQVILFLQGGPSSTSMRLSSAGTFTIEGESIGNLDKRIHVQMDKTDPATFLTKIGEVSSQCK